MPNEVRGFLFYLCLSLCIGTCWGDPLTKPYIAYLTSPFDQQHEQPGESNGHRERVYVTKYLQWSLDDSEKEESIQESNNSESSQCSERMDIQYTVRHSTPSHEVDDMEILSPPAIYPMSPSSPGKSLFFLRHEEILDAVSFSPSNNGGDSHYHHHHGPAFPLLFQGSTFANASPLILDANQDGFEDIVVVDYDGMMTIIGLQSHYDQESKKQKRFMREIQIPRLIVRRDWVANTINSTRMEELLRADLNPHESYFEYLSEWTGTMRFQHGKEQSVPGSEHMRFRGESADMLHQSYDIADILYKRKVARQFIDAYNDAVAPTALDEDSTLAKEEKIFTSKEDSALHGRRLQEIEVDESSVNEQSSSNTEVSTQEDENPNAQQTGESFIDKHNARYYNPDNGDEGEDFREYYRYDDDFYGSPNDHLSPEHDFHEEEKYLHIPPHVLSTPTYFESLKHDPDNSDKVYEEYLAIAVSYFFDEDEYAATNARQKRFMNDWGGDETEAKRGQYVASALVIVNLQDHYKGGSQIHLDLSTDNSAPLPPEEELVGEAGKGKLDWHENDYDGMGAFALASPVAADLDRDGKMEVLVVSSMGFIHCIQVPNRIGINDRRFTVQMKSRIEHSVVVGNVVGDANLEVLALDTNGNVICIDHSGASIWHRSLSTTTVPRITSDLVLSDLNGDGEMDLLLTVLRDSKLILYALVAKTGRNLDGFPKEITASPPEGILTIPTPVIVPGTENGVHIAQPLDNKLHVVDLSTDCIQTIAVGTQLSSVQIADVSGNGTIDLIATSTSGEILLVETSTSLSLAGLDTLKGIRVSERSKRWRNVHGVSIPITFTIHDKGLGEPEADQKYDVEMRVNRSSKNVIFRKEYAAGGTYTEKVLFPFSPGYYVLTLRLRGDDGIFYDDEIYFAFNVNSPSLAIAGWIILAPLIIVSVSLLFVNKRMGASEGNNGLL